MISILAYGVIVHFVFLASIFIIYFQSPVIQGIEPQSNLVDAPAKRLVLFVADGLRAESFYRNGCNRTKFLQNVILDEGIHGISHTRIPTESRPGHVALIAGLYEDPSAVLRGWQDNPVNFDSLFNRSRVTYSWGSPDILSIFTKENSKHHIHTASYSTSDEDFSGKASTINLDKWVFDRFERFLSETDPDSVSDDRTVFFLHLLGLDTAGHVHKPNTKLFNDNLLAVDKGIEKTVQLVNAFFDDSETAFIFTADHGMTDGGSHGTGNAHETETPFIAWGAGINHWRDIQHPIDVRNVQVGDQLVPRFDMSQADCAPLMASIIGVAVPVNSFGTLPLDYLKCTPNYASRAMQGNALQMAAQFKVLRHDFSQGYFSRYMKDFETLNANISEKIEQLIATSISNGKYDQAVQMSRDYIQNALEGVEYFQLYYQHVLLLSVCISMMGWMVFLTQRVAIRRNSMSKSMFSERFIYGSLLSLAVLIISFILLQRIPWSIGFLFLLPIICWAPCNAWQTIEIVLNKYTWFFIVATDIIVWTFFYRFLLSVILIHVPLIYILTLRGSTSRIVQRNYIWILSCIALAIFPSLPLVGQMSHHKIYLLVGLALWLGKVSHATYYHFNWTIATNLILLAITAGNLMIVVVGFEHQRGLMLISQLLSWAITGISLILPLLQDKPRRLPAIANGLCLPYILTSISYEAIFLFVLAVNLESWVQMEIRESSEVSHAPVGRHDFRRAYVVLIYVLISFFGTGNLASISSFDPNCVRCFVGTFSPFVMAALIIMKLFIPVLIVMCASTAITIHKKIHSETLFIIILLMCDIMCAHFLFCVKNKGSWLDIGTSISHFVIMESTALVLCVLDHVSRLLLQVELKPRRNPKSD